MTLFTALLTLDARRQHDERDACLCCLKLSSDYKAPGFSEKNILQSFLGNSFSSMVLSTPGKIVILLVTAGLFGTGIYGLLQLEQNFDFIWFLPSDSRPRVYTERSREVRHAILCSLDNWQSLKCQQLNKSKEIVYIETSLAKGKERKGHYLFSFKYLQVLIVYFTIDGDLFNSA